MQSATPPSQSSTDSPQNTSLKRAMSTRHLIMLSLGGAIGTGLFMGSGEVISQAGPLGAVLAYIIGGLIAYMVMLCLGELAVHLPVLVHLVPLQHFILALAQAIWFRGCIGSAGRQHLAPNLPQQPFWYRNGSHKRRSGYGR